MEIIRIPIEKGSEEYLGWGGPKVGGMPTNFDLPT
jgi:hypothetical protein